MAVKTAFPGLAEAQGVKPSNIEVVKPAPGNVAAQVQNNAEETAEATTATENNTETQAAEQVVAAKPFEEMDDKEAIRLFNKKFGTKFKSVEDLKEPEPAPTAEQIQLAQEKEQTESLQWALATGVKKEVYDRAQADKLKSPRDLALSIFSAEALADNKDLTSEEVEDMFKEYYCEDQAENTWKRKKMLAEMNRVASNYLKDNYSDIENIPENFRAHKTVEAKQNKYIKQVKEVMGEIPQELSLTIKDIGVDGAEGEFQYTIPIDKSITDKLVKEFANPNMFFSLGADEEEIKSEFLKKELQYHINARTRDLVIAHVATKHAEAMVANAMVKLKNIPVSQQQLHTVIPARTEGKAPPAHSSLKKFQEDHKL